MFLDREQRKMSLGLKQMLPGCVSLGFSSINYGEFLRTNEIGEQGSTFSASDQIFSLYKVHHQ